MSSNLIKAQDVFLAKINQMCSRFGLNNIMAELYAIMYLSEKPLSLNDMVDRLKISKGSASVNIRVLERYGVVRRVWVRGSRKDYYEAETEISKVIIERIRSMAQRRLSEVENMVSASCEALESIDPVNADESKAIETFKARLEKLRVFYNQAKYMFDLFNMSMAAGAFTAVPKISEEKIPAEGKVLAGR